jgi:hypothetical protein
MDPRDTERPDAPEPSVSAIGATGAIDISSISDDNIRKNADGSFTLCGCGKPNCPTIISRPDGSMTIMDTVDGMTEEIHFDGKQAVKLYELLELTYAQKGPR